MSGYQLVETSLPALTTCHDPGPSYYLNRSMFSLSDFLFVVQIQESREQDIPYRITLAGTLRNHGWSEVFPSPLPMCRVFANEQRRIRLPSDEEVYCRHSPIPWKIHCPRSHSSESHG